MQSEEVEQRDVTIRKNKASYTGLKTEMQFLKYLE